MIATLLTFRGILAARTLAGLVCVAALLATVRTAEASTLLRRGDADANAALELTDGIRILDFLFLGADSLPCQDAGDADDSSALDISDPIYIFQYLFLGGPPPAAPFPDCGGDTTPDDLGCDRFPPCADEFAELAQSFGTIDTLAGTGLTQNDNGWRPAFEGKPAVEAELSAPHVSLGDAAGNIYIADKEAHAIRKVTPEGTIHTVAGTGSPGDGPDTPGPGVERALSNPNGLWVLADGTLYILDLDNEKVRKLTPVGILSTFLELPGLRTGRGLWVADDESTAFVTSQDRLVRWTREGGLEILAAEFADLGNIYVESNGNVLVTDRGRHQVFRVTPDGLTTPVAGNRTTTGGGDGRPALETGLDQVRGVWGHEEKGGFFVATHRGSQVWYVDTAGIIHLFLDGMSGVHAGDGEPFDAPGPKVSEIRSVTMDRRGNLLVTENDFGFVRIVFRKP